MTNVFIIYRNLERRHGIAYIGFIGYVSSQLYPFPRILYYIFIRLAIQWFSYSVFHKTLPKKFRNYCSVKLSVKNLRVAKLIFKHIFCFKNIQELPEKGTHKGKYKNPKVHKCKKHKNQKVQKCRKCIIQK